MRIVATRRGRGMGDGALLERPDTLLGLPITWVEGDGKPLNIIIGTYGPNLEFIMQPGEEPEPDD